MAAPTKMTDGCVQKLLLAFGLGSCVKDACLFAGISRQTYYNYVQENPDFLDRIERVKGLEELCVKIRWMQIMETADDQTAIELGKYILERSERREEARCGTLATC